MSVLPYAGPEVMAEWAAAQMARGPDFVIGPADDPYLRRWWINPVATQLCRSGECMCGTMQTPQERAEAAVIYPEWGNWLNGLEAEARRLHGFGWGEPFPKPVDARQADLFQPMCKDCVRKAA